MVVIGISNALIDVAGFTLAQRTSPNDSRVAVLGLLDSAANAGVALGGILAPVLIAWLGIRGALVVTGSILPVAALLVWPVLRKVNEGGAGLAERSERIRGVPLFAPLSLATVDYLAARLEPFAAADGDWLMREGEAGDRFYLIDTGDIEISQGGRTLRTLGPGAGVGEIALLHDVPRTASVQARRPGHRVCPRPGGVRRGRHGPLGEPHPGDDTRGRAPQGGRDRLSPTLVAHACGGSPASDPSPETRVPCPTDRPATPTTGRAIPPSATPRR